MTQRILGPGGSRRRRRIALLVPLAVVAVMVLAMVGSAANTTLANFEIDGNLVAQDSGATGEDWVNAANTGADSATAALKCTVGSCAPGNVTDGSGNGTGELFRDDLKVDPDRTTFTQGDKENDFANVTTFNTTTGQLQSDTPWHIVSGATPPQKDDLFDIVTNTYVVGNQAELDLGMVRTNNNGSSHVDFELNQQDWTPGGSGGVACATNDTGDPDFLCPKRTEGDLLISFEISPSSTTPPVSVNARYFVWDLPGGTNANGHGRGGATGSVECEGPLSGNEKTCPWEEIEAPTASLLTVASNTGPIPAAPWGSRNPDGTSATQYPAGGWFEAGLDLDQLGFPPSCPGFGTGSAKARSSGSSVTSALTDLAGPFPIDLNTCGKITIIKDAVPNDAQDFSYATTSTGSTIDSSFSLDDDSDNTLSNTKVFDQIGPGTYTFTEGDPTVFSPKWDLTNLVCTNAAGDTSSTFSVDLTLRKATVNLGNLGDVTCTFTNTKRGSITIVKDTVPNGPQDFAYTSTSSTSTAIGSFSLDDDSDGTLPNSRTFSDLKPGSYTVTETLPVTGFDLTGLSCTSSGTGTSTTTTLATGLSSITLGAGGSATCTYVNSQRNSLIIRKTAKDKNCTAPGVPNASCIGASSRLLGGAGFTITPDPTTGTGTLVISDNGTGDQFSSAGLICIDNVKPGITFAVSETTVPANHQGGADQTGVASSLGTCASRGTSSTPNATFDNKPLTTITVSTNSLAGAGVTASTVQCATEASASPTPHTTTGLPPGTYTCTIIIDP